MRYLFGNGVRVLTFLSISAVLFSSYPAGGQTTLHVAVSIPPQKYFVKKIGGDHVDVTVMVPSGAEPHTYEPKPRQLISLSKSSLYFAIGIPFEHTWLDRFEAANPHVLVIHTDNGIQKIPMHSEEDNKKAQTAHHHDRMDPHIWLSPSAVKKQAERIYDAFVKTDPENKEIYRRNYETFMRELDELDMYLKNIFPENGGQIRFMVFHPSWGYFAREYGLEQIPIEMEGKEPKPADLIRLISTAKKLGIRAVFIQPQYSAKSARTIADAIDGEIVYADPLSENWEQNLRNVAQQIKRALR